MAPRWETSALAAGEARSSAGLATAAAQRAVRTAADAAEVGRVATRSEEGLSGPHHDVWCAWLSPRRRFLFEPGGDEAELPLTAGQRMAARSADPGRPEHAAPQVRGALAEVVGLEARGGELGSPRKP